MTISRDLSLFSPQALTKRHNRALLLSFILAELFEAHKIFLSNGDWQSILSCHPRFFPYDWTTPSGSLNKLKEHALLLKKSFPDERLCVKKVEQHLKKMFAAWEKKAPSKAQFEHMLQILYSSMEPLLERCKDNENLIYFLLKNRHAIDTLMHQGHLKSFLLKAHPDGLENLGEKMCDQYHQRGFISQIPELKLLMVDLAHDA